MRGMTRRRYHRKTALAMAAAAAPLFLAGFFTFGIAFIPALVLAVWAQRLWGPRPIKPTRPRRRVRLQPLIFWRL